MNVKLHPGSRQEKIVKIDENNLEVWIKQKPIEGKANIYLEKMLKKYFGRSFKIIKGLKSKNKVLEIEE